MTELSPTAQLVLDAANGACMYRPDPEDTRRAAAAALRAAANQVVPRKNVDESAPLREITRSVQRLEIRAQLLAIAAELEAPPNNSEGAF